MKKDIFSASLYFIGASSLLFSVMNCIVCHGGNPEAKSATEAYQGNIAYFSNTKGLKSIKKA